MWPQWQPSTNSGFLEAGNNEQLEDINPEDSASKVSKTSTLLMPIIKEFK